MPIFTPDRPDVTTNRPAVLAAAKAESSDSRWARWTTAGAQHDSMDRRGGWVIAGVVTAGMLTWLLATNL